MQRHGGVEIGLGGPHLHGDGGELDHLGRALPDDVAADHAAGLAVDHSFSSTVVSRPDSVALSGLNMDL